MSTTTTASLSSLFVVVVGLCLVVAQHVEVVVPQSRASARRLLHLSREVAQSLLALNFRLNQSATCYVIEHVSDVTVDDVTVTSHGR